MSADRKVPAAIRKYFEIRPVMPGEDVTVYDQLRNALIEELEPGSIQEWLLVQDMADTEWELIRQRTMKARMVQAEMPRCFGKILFEDTPAPGLVDLDDAHEHVQQVRALLNGFKPAPADALQKVLGNEGLTVEALAAKAFAATIVQQQHTERMATATSKRRNAAAAELERLQQRRQTAHTKTAHTKAPKSSREPPLVNARAATTAPKADEPVS